MFHKKHEAAGWLDRDARLRSVGEADSVYCLLSFGGHSQKPRRTMLGAIYHVDMASTPATVICFHKMAWRRQHRDDGTRQ
ncbi:hypothetical protein HYQ45_014424 [Verticillium longisporum]|uniref:Uncharacterized protein n=1 Tax=Verticillium longisporum TaxID=100787 RepID=A0A8I2Z8S9_VERLO|nr:hypothetical protein HYQ45_014424 [Verticillium longisporum]